MTFSAVLPATRLPLGQFPINPLEPSLCCQGCAQKTSELAAQGSSLENGKLEGTGEGPWKGPDKGFVLSIL